MKTKSSRSKRPTMPAILMLAFSMSAFAGPSQPDKPKVMHSPKGAELLGSVKAHQFEHPIVLTPWKWNWLSAKSEPHFAMLSVADVPQLTELTERKVTISQSSPLLLGASTKSSASKAIILPHIATITWNALGSGVGYIVERSLDLSNWETLSVTSSNSVTFPTLNDAEFYRVLSYRSTVNVTLAWDPSTDFSVAGYRVYYYNSNSDTTNGVDVGPSTTVTIPIAVGKTYQFYATEYNDWGQESLPSNSVEYTAEVPEVEPVVLQLNITR